jgi:DegV family protein with EDD domain
MKSTEDQPMRIIADTTCHFSVAEAEAANVILVPNQISIGDTNYRDYLDIDPETFVDEIKNGFARTSQPSIGDVIQAYEDCGSESTIHITTGKGLSSAYESACSVKESMHAENIAVFNSESVAGPNRYLVQLAVRLSSTTASLKQIIERMQRCIKECQSYVIPVNFMFLQRSGRLTPLAAKIGGFLQIKPVMSQSDDRERIEKFSINRTWIGAINSIVDDLVKHGVSAKHRIYVAHALNPDIAKLAIEKIISRIQNTDIEILKLAPSMITHGGPGCLVIQYILKDEEG